MVAQGTADELKDHLGGNVLEIRVADRHDLDKAAPSFLVSSVDRPRLDSTSNRSDFPSKAAPKC